MTRPSDDPDYRQCEEEHLDLMSQLAMREAQIEQGIIDSYDDFPLDWDRPAAAPRRADLPPSAPSRSARRRR